MGSYFFASRVVTNAPVLEKEVIALMWADFNGTKAGATGGGTELGTIRSGDRKDRDSVGCSDFSENIGDGTMGPAHELSVFAARAALVRTVAVEVFDDDHVGDFSFRGDFVFAVERIRSGGGGGLSCAFELKTKGVGQDEVGGLFNTLFFELIQFLEEFGRGVRNISTISPVADGGFDPDGTIDLPLIGSQSAAEIFDGFDSLGVESALLINLGFCWG